MNYQKITQSKILSLIFPNRCPFCLRVIYRDETVCPSCAKKLPQFTYRRFAAGGVACSAALPYHDGYAEAVKRFKFGKKAFFAHPFAKLMTDAAARVYTLENYDFVTCVPMHPKDTRKRRYNQSELLARECAEMMNLPYNETLEKYKKNKPQHSLKRSRREENVKGVYRVIDKSVLKGKRVLLIDDIITTGNTLGECARMLKRGGCRSVSCAVLCTTLV